MLTVAHLSTGLYMLVVQGARKLWDTVPFGFVHGASKISQAELLWVIHKADLIRWHVDQLAFLESYLQFAVRAFA